MSFATPLKDKDSQIIDKQQGKQYASKDHKSAV